MPSNGLLIIAGLFAAHPPNASAVTTTRPCWVKRFPVIRLLAIVGTCRRVNYKRRLVLLLATHLSYNDLAAWVNIPGRRPTGWREGSASPSVTIWLEAAFTYTYLDRHTTIRNTDLKFYNKDL